MANFFVNSFEKHGKTVGDGDDLGEIVVVVVFAPLYCLKYFDFDMNCVFFLKGTVPYMYL